MDVSLSGFRVPTPILMRRSKSQQKGKATPLVKRLLMGLSSTSAGEHPASLPHKRVDTLKAEMGVVTVAKKPPTLRDFFTRVTAQDLVQIDGKHFASVTEETSIAEAIDVMVKNRLTSIPVKNSNGLFSSVFCVYDVIDYLAETGKMIQMKDLAISEPYRCSLHFQTEFSQLTVKEVSRNPWVTIGGHATLLDCLSHFGSHSTHLLGVVADKTKDNTTITNNHNHNEVIGVLHRVQILKFLFYNKEMAKELMQRPLSAFRHLNHAVSLKADNHTVKANSLQEVFCSIWQKVLDGDMVSYGHSNVDKFVNILVQIMMVDHEELPELDYDTVRETDTVEHVFGMIVKANTTNMKAIVLDKEKKPVGTLCFCDFITELYRMACSNCTPHSPHH